MPKKTDNYQQKINEITADLQRIQAEFINYKARAERERLESLNIGKEFILIELLPVLDSLERAFQHAPENLQNDPWVKGVMGLEKQLNSLLKNIGLEKIDTVGKVFDPNTMEAVSVEEAGGDEEVVIAELQSGYQYAGRVIRPATVQVKK